MNFKQRYVFVAAVCLVALTAWADSLELKNGSVINGKFVGATGNEISFQVGSSVQKYNLADINSMKLDSGAPALSTRSSTSDSTAAASGSKATATIPAGTQISIRTIDSIDSTKNHVGDRFQASLEEPLVVDGNVVVEKGADVYGRLAEAKTSGTFTGRSQLQLELTGIVVNGQTIPLVTGEYELSGKSRSSSTAKRTVGGAAVGSIIGAIAGHGKGAAIGAGTGAAVGAGSEVITKGDQVKIPSETMLEFTLKQEVSIPVQRS
jgi:outer membrane lipoprotein SlyB